MKRILKNDINFLKLMVDVYVNYIKLKFKKCRLKSLTILPETTSSFATSFKADIIIMFKS